MNKCLKKATSILLVIIFFVQLGISQDALKTALQGEWIKDKITLKDGSPIYDDMIINSSFSLDFRADSLIVSYDGKHIPSTYRLKDSVISYRNTYYKIIRLDKPILEVWQVNNSDEVEPIRIKFLFKPTFDLGTSPEYYFANNGEKVYINEANVVEPKFLDSRYSAMDFIYANFKYPEYRKGGFVIRFVITKNGDLSGIRMVASSNEKYDEKLLTALMKTKGRWLPAKYQNENVNCEVELNYDLGYTSAEASVNQSATASESAAEYEANGKWYYGAKNYKSAIYYFSKAIEINPYLVDAHYLRAASYISKKDINSACGDYLQLKNLGQKKASDLYDKYCGDYEPQSQQ